jgi:transcription elongation factor Elf1
MIAVYDFVPSFCPNCGKEIDLTGRAPGGYWRDADYNAGASHECQGCGLMYQRAAREDILTAADAYGAYADLMKYA